MVRVFNLTSSVIIVFRVRRTLCLRDLRVVFSDNIPVSCIAFLGGRRNVEASFVPYEVLDVKRLLQARSRFLVRYKNVC